MAIAERCAEWILGKDSSIERSKELPSPIPETVSGRPTQEIKEPLPSRPKTSGYAVVPQSR